MNKKLQNGIQSERTIDTPYAKRPILTNNINSYDASMNNIPIRPIGQMRRISFLPQNEKSTSGQNLARLQISNQYNESNTINKSKSRSLARQEQNSFQFNNRTLNRSSKQQNISKDVNNSIKNQTLTMRVLEKSHSADQVIYPRQKSLKRKTEQLKFGKTNQYLQEVKKRRILQYHDICNQFSMADLTQKIQNKQPFEPKLNVQVCQQYMSLNRSLPYQGPKPNSTKYNSNNLNISKQKQRQRQLFPKSKQFNLQASLNQTKLNNDYYNCSSKNNLPINSKTLMMSQKYKFKLNSNNNFKKEPLKQNNPLANKRVSFSINLTDQKQLLTGSMPFFNKRVRTQQALSTSFALKKTQKLITEINQSQILMNRNSKEIGRKPKSFFTSNNRANQQNLIQSIQEYIKVKNVPQNIMIQQEGFDNLSAIRKMNAQQQTQYGIQPNLRNYQVKLSTKLFICSYCLQVFAIVQLNHHKGSVCNIPHKQPQFVQKIIKLSSFLLTIYEEYYQKRQFYKCFQTLSKKLLLKLEHFTNQQKFHSLKQRLLTVFYHKQNYSKHKYFSIAQKEQFFVDKIQAVLHLEEFFQIQKTFVSVYEMIDLGNTQNNYNVNLKRAQTHKSKIIIINDLFWLISKLFEGLVLIKVKQIQQKQNKST